jgi:hypothetical protein
VDFQFSETERSDAKKSSPRVIQDGGVFFGLFFQYGMERMSLQGGGVGRTF